MKRKELFWMIAPCLLLIGAGAYFSRRPVKEFQIVIDEAKLVPVTPYEVSKGYDTKAVIKTSLRGVSRADAQSMKIRLWHMGNVQIVCIKDGRETIVPRSFIGDETANHPDGTEITEERTFYLKLADVPDSWGKLDLKIKKYAEQYSYAAKRVVRQTPEVSSLLLLRKAGQSIARPQPNKTRPFKLKKITSQWYSGMGGYGSACLVTVHLTALDSSVSKENFKYTIDNYVWETEKGLFPAEYQYTGTHNPPDRSAEIKGWQGVDVPLKQRNITLKAKISINDCWPFPISIVLRKDGQNINS